MTPTSTRTELEESILTCCKSLFFDLRDTRADKNRMVLQSRSNTLLSLCKRKSLAVTRIRELVWLREPVSLFIKLLKAMNTVV